MADLLRFLEAIQTWADVDAELGEHPFRNDPVFLMGYGQAQNDVRKLQALYGWLT